MTLQYRFDRRAGSDMPETTVSLNGTNILDRPPPYVANSYGLMFDGVNGDPRGRFISAQVSARW